MKVKQRSDFFADLIREVLKLDDEVLEIAKKIYKERSLLIMGRGYNFATCLEGALKIKVCALVYMYSVGVYVYSVDFFLDLRSFRNCHICTVKE